MADAVLLLAHGTPDVVEEIPEYLSRVTGGRPLPHEVIEEVSHRFSLIGGSPLTRLTLEQGSLLQQELGLPVYVGMRNWKPYIADVVHQMRADGVTRAVVICLAPQNSRTSVGLYRRAVFAAAENAIELRFLDDWADHPHLIEGFVDRLRAARDPFSAEVGAPVPVLFTAHSVPCRTVLSTTPANAASHASRSEATGTAANTLPATSALRASRSEATGTAANTPPATSALHASRSEATGTAAKTPPATSALHASRSEATGTAANTPPATSALHASRSEATVEAPAFRPGKSAPKTEGALAPDSPPPPDPYPIEAKQTARLVAEKIPGLPESNWFFAFQSQGMSGGPWLGPTVEDTLTALHQQGVTNLVIQPIGFLCDHVEILYDIDIGFRDFAAKLGITTRRPTSLNESHQLTLALADLARRGLA